MSLIDGCTYVTGSGKDAKRIFCGKLPAQGSHLCLKHIAIAADEDALEARRIVRLREARLARRGREEALAQSPLAALNPALDKRGWQE